ncbi:MAG: excinuclease ABC subunit B, partial [Desulfobacterales bacterium]|nr:excinuclease ABC subunit B [Desulfobacterales bacterium]
FHRGTFRVRGDRVEIFPAYEAETAIRVDFFGDEIDGLSEIDPLRGKVIRRLKKAAIFPASHYVTKKQTIKRALKTIIEELKGRLEHFRNENKPIETQRIEERTNFDLELLEELGYCNGIENYSRHFTGRAPGEPPPTLLDYFPDDFLMFIDESHIATPQLRAMYRGDRSRKETLVRFGFRLPSALDNRPLKFEEVMERINQVVYVSATPADYEMEMAGGARVEQIVRPTGLVDPEVDVRPAKNQVDDLYEEILKRVKRSERVLATTLTKRMAEDLTEYFSDLGVRVRYLHADITTLERMDIIRDLRLGEFDVLVGINLLREGLDIPEVSLVAILDADKEGFLRSARSLIQTCGRASRNVRGEVIMYADVVTRSMQQALEETGRRRKIQEAYNEKHQITPTTIRKKITPLFEALYESDAKEGRIDEVGDPAAVYAGAPGAIDELVASLEKEMKEAAKELAFEKAAVLRDQIKALQEYGR